jgi:heat shock protein HslJ
VADCNVGAGTFTLDGAVTGSIRTQLGPSTLAACGPDSWGQTFVDTLTASQDFRILPGGNRMLLYMPAGGPVVTFVKAGPAEEPPAEPQPTVEIPTPAPVIPTGRVTGSPGVNVRSGPGTDYPIIGFANFGATGQVVGRSEDGQWWATPVSTAPTGLGWLSAAYVVVTGGEYVPVIAAPPPPPTATPVPPAATATPTSVPPTATPTAAPEIAFWADRTQINQGECARLSWRAVNVQAVWVYPVGQNYQSYPQGGEGSQVVCPQSTTTYEMRVQLRDGSLVFQQITIQVRAIPTATPIPPTPTAVPPTATPVPPTDTPVPPTATPIPTEPPAPGNPLANTSWAVLRFENFGVPVGDAAPAIFFTGDGRTEIFGGCNTFSGAYSVYDSGITITVGPGTMMLCGDEIDQQESYYLQLLSRAALFELPPGELVLRDGSGWELLRFN